MTHPCGFHGVLQRVERDGETRLVPHADRPASIPCPKSGRDLKIAAIEATAPARCPACMQAGNGAFLSFVSDLRMAYACPQCDQLVWVAGS